VHFSGMASDRASAASGSNTSSALRRSRIYELEDDDDADMEAPADDDFFPPQPLLSTRLPELRDTLVTKTSKEQDATVEECLQLLSQPEGDLNVHGISSLARSKHINFLKLGLAGPLPRGFVAADASRPWLLYWALTALYLLGEDVSVYRDQVVSTLAPIQNASGGFGGGHGHFSHIATTYAAVLSLVYVGGEALNLVDRKAMYVDAVTTLCFKY
jgi:protein farnesyltransferase subunit beta